MSRATPHDRLSGMVIGPIIWAAHFLFVYIFQAVGCSLALHQRTWGGVNAIDAVLLLGTLLLLGAVLWGGVRALRAWRRYRGVGDDDFARRAAFMNGVALALYALSFLAIVWVTLPVLILPDPCRS